MIDTSALKTLYETLYGPLNKSGPTPNITRNCKELAETLSKAVKRKKPWTHQYLCSILNDEMPLRPALHRAVLIIGARLDGAPPLQARLREISVYTVNGLEPGIIVFGKQTRCGYCQVPILRNPHNRQYCCVECRVAKAKEK